MKVAAVIFDLDGTITRPYLDFDQIRSEIGNISGPILEEMAKMTPPQRRRAEDILLRYELEAAENSQLNPGASELLTALRGQKRFIGLATRNSHDSVRRICRKHNLAFDCVVTRQDGPVKPDPFSVRHACQLVNVSPQQALLVGDYVFDLISARRAGAVSVLLNNQDNYADFEHEADYIISELNQLGQIIESLEKGE
jgi:HAD superfamily hydrolase (TIGR01509 family)